MREALLLLLLAAPGDAPSAIWPAAGPATLSIWWRAARTCDSPAVPAGSTFACWHTGLRLGRARVARAWHDRRGQPIPPGDYTLRYAVQPRSKDHLGTTAGRDFLLLVPAALDPGSETMPELPLWAASRHSAGGSHPAVLELRTPGAAGNGESLLRTAIDGVAIDLVVEGPAPPPVDL